MKLSHDKAASVLASLQQVGAKERRRSLAGFIREIAPELLKARRDRNLSFEDLRAVLTEQGVEISLLTLKRYLAPSGRKAKTKAPVRKTGKGSEAVPIGARSQSEAPPKAESKAPASGETGGSPPAPRAIPPMPKPPKPRPVSSLTKPSAAPTAKPDAEADAKPSADKPLRPWEFAVRPDRKDL